VYEVIVAAVDGSAGGYAALARAVELAKCFQARLIALSVEEGLPRYAATISEVDDWKEQKDRYFAEVRAEAKRIAAEHEISLQHRIGIGHAADVIVRFVDEVGADLVVLGYKGHSRIAQFVIGTTAQKVNAYAHASVLIVKPTSGAEGVWDRIVGFPRGRP